MLKQVVCSDRKPALPNKSPGADAAANGAVDQGALTVARPFPLTFAQPCSKCGACGPCEDKADELELAETELAAKKRGCRSCGLSPRKALSIANLQTLPLLERIEAERRNAANWRCDGDSDTWCMVPESGCLDEESY